MKSKIPYPKAIRNEEKRIASGVHTNDPTLVYDALNLLGAPHIEREEFNRIYHGPLAVALNFISEHMKGRQEVALARHRIHQIREARLKSHLKQPDDITRPPTDKSTSILSGVKRNAEILRKQLDDRQLELEETQDALESLKRDLKRKQRTKLLLSVLEQKEKIRVKRFQEITTLINDLKKTISEVNHQTSLPHSTELSLKTTQANMLKSRPPRISCTSNALANLYAYHLRSSRLVKPGRSESELLVQLRTVISRQTGKPPTDPSVGKILDQFISVARTRGRERAQFQNNNLPPVSEVELERKLKRNQDREKELQNVIDLTVALGFLCEHSISSVNSFIQKSSPVLRASLDEEAPLTKGYIDVLRCIIMTDPKEVAREPRFVEQVKTVCKLKGRIVPSEIVAWVENSIRKTHQQELFLKSLAIPQPSPLTERQEALIASYRIDTKDIQDRTVQLLTRKAEKAEMGYTLVKDIQNLIQETKIIVG